MCACEEECILVIHRLQNLRTYWRDVATWPEVTGGPVLWIGPNPKHWELLIDASLRGARHPQQRVEVVTISRFLGLRVVWSLQTSVARIEESTAASALTTSTGTVERLPTSCISTWFGSDEDGRKDHLSRHCSQTLPQQGPGQNKGPHTLPSMDRSPCCYQGSFGPQVNQTQGKRNSTVYNMCTCIWMYRSSCLYVLRCFSRKSFLFYPFWSERHVFF